MLCPDCKVDAYIMQSKTEVTGDDNPDVQTEVWNAVDFECRNQACPKCGKVVGHIRHRIYPPPDSGDSPL